MKKNRHKILYTVLILTFLIVAFLYLFVFPQTKSNKRFSGNPPTTEGTITIKLLAYDSVSKEFTHPLFPAFKMLLYGNYLVEMNNVTHQVMINNQLESEKYYIGSYFFIDFEQKQFTEYESFSINGKKLETHSLLEKKTGFRFENGIDFFAGKHHEILILDTMLNQKYYKKLAVFQPAVKGSGPLRIIAFLDPSLEPLQVHLSKTLDDRFKGRVTRLDIESTTNQQRMSYQMDFRSHRLADTAVATILQWQNSHKL